MVKLNIEKFRKRKVVHQCDTCYQYEHKTCDGPLTCSKCDQEHSRSDCKSLYTVCVPFIRKEEPNHTHPTHKSKDSVPSVRKKPGQNTRGGRPAKTRRIK